MLRFLSILLICSGCGKKITDNSSNKRSYRVPQENLYFDSRMFSDIDFLPLEGKIKNTFSPWSGSIWPFNKGAINFRWNSPSEEDFYYISPSRREVQTLPSRIIKSLSPSEKFDLYMGRYDYPLKKEVEHLSKGRFANWEGLCHGWASAALHHPEPEPITVTNPEGVEIHFGSSDIKALLTYAYSKVIINQKKILGLRCDEFSSRGCKNDLTPDHFHLVLANKLGLQGEGFIADMDQYNEVWNHPIVAFKTSILVMKNHRRGRTGVFETKITYLESVDKNSWNKHPAIFSYMTFKYQLEMDISGSIVSGKWIGHERPDFLWTVKRIHRFSGLLDGLSKLL